MILNQKNISKYLSERGYFNYKPESIRNLRHFVAVVESIDHKKLLIKQKGDNNLKFSEVSLDNEFLFYNQNSHNLKNLAPNLLLSDAENDILVIEYLEGYVDLNLILNQNSIDTSYYLGKQIANVHNTSIDSDKLTQTKINASQYLSSFETVTPEQINYGGPLFSKFIELIQKYPQLNLEIKKLRQKVEFNCFIHGDLKSDNILMNTNNPEKIKLIDWELSGVGDRYIDLGYRMADYILIRIKNMVFDSTNNNNDELMATCIDHMNVFLEGYLSSLLKNINLDHKKLTKFTAIALLSNFYSKSAFKRTYSKQDIMVLKTAKIMLIETDTVYQKLFLKNIISNYEDTFK